MPTCEDFIKMILFATYFRLIYLCDWFLNRVFFEHWSFDQVFELVVSTLHSSSLTCSSPQRFCYYRACILELSHETASAFVTQALIAFLYLDTAQLHQATPCIQHTWFENHCGFARTRKIVAVCKEKQWMGPLVEYFKANEMACFREYLQNPECTCDESCNAPGDNDLETELELLLNSDH